jgi:hypothetical protein
VTPEQFLQLPVRERARRVLFDRKNCPAVDAPFTPEEFKTLPLVQRLRIWDMDPGVDYGVSASSLVHEAADAIEDVEEERSEVVNVLRELILRVHWVTFHPSIVSMFVVNAARSGRQYIGPTWKDALEAALRLFKRTDLPEPKYPQPQYGAYRTTDFHNTEAEPEFKGTAEEVSAWIKMQEASYFLAPTKDHFPGNTYEDFCAEANLVWRDSEE